MRTETALMERAISSASPMTRRFGAGGGFKLIEGNDRAGADFDDFAVNAEFLQNVFQVAGDFFQFFFVHVVGVVRFGFGQDINAGVLIIIIGAGTVNRQFFGFFFGCGFFVFGRFVFFKFGFFAFARRFGFGDAGGFFVVGTAAEVEDGFESIPQPNDGDFGTAADFAGGIEPVAESDAGGEVKSQQA